MVAAVGVAELAKPDTPRRIEGELRAWAATKLNPSTILVGSLTELA